MVVKMPRQGEPYSKTTKLLGYVGLVSQLRNKVLKLKVLTKLSWFIKVKKVICHQNNGTKILAG